MYVLCVTHTTEDRLSAPLVKPLMIHIQCLMKSTIIDKALPSSSTAQGANDAAVLVQIFTPGPCCMEFSARWYGAAWKFREQGLPADLMARCHVAFVEEIPPSLE